MVQPKKAAARCYPADLAVQVKRALRQRRNRCPSLAILHELFEVMYFASLQEEEAEPIRCTVTYVSFRSPDPSPPLRIVPDRWSCTPFSEHINMSIKNLVKLAKAADPDTSSLAVYAGEKGLVVWGIIDQQFRRREFVDRESNEGPEVPGIFHASIVGVGNVVIGKDYATLATLRQGRIATKSDDVLRRGPVFSVLAAPIAATIEKTRSAVGDLKYDLREHWNSSLTENYVRTLTRVILGIQRYEHGGALLITASDTDQGLRMKYPLFYPRLSYALDRLAIATIRRTNASDESMDQYLDKEKELMPVLLHLDQSVFGAEVDDCESEITGCIRFIASFSRVDGCVVLNPSLVVRGFGAVITVDKEPDAAWLAHDDFGRAAKLEPIRPSHFGTRHQSMMRYCYRQPGSVGLVISQDGDVRAMTRVGDRLVVWEDVKLRLG